MILEIDARCRLSSPKSAEDWMGTAISSTGEKLGANDLFFTRDGEPWIPVMGEIHFTRLPRKCWADALRKMKASGIEVVAGYVIWIHHEEEEGRIDWSGNRDLRYFVELCGAHGLKFWARIGPWAHGEVRNGGLPDWLFEKGRVRSMDSGFLAEAHRFHAEIARQLNGLLFKDGGPVIGVQLENELFFGDREAVDYMRELKRFALAQGLDVPFYSATAWHGFHDDVADLLPVMGTYPDAPWDPSTEPVFQKAFLFDSDLEDPSIGADLISSGTHKPAPRSRIKRFPFASAELGGGMQVTWHRRVRVSSRDVSVPAVVYLGAGANLLGYYMFHGGMNPRGEYASLQESRDTFYPNDVPLMDYDFQSPIGACGEVRESAGYYRALHSLVRDFGAILGPMRSCLPDVLPGGPEDRETFRFAARTEGGSGFLFLVNYQRYVPLGEKRDLRFRIRLPEGDVVFPREPVSFPDGESAIWPFNLALDGVKLLYATAQPFGRITDGGEPVFFFFAIDGVRTEMAFDGASAAGFEPSGIELFHQAGIVMAVVDRPGFDVGLRVQAAESGNWIRIKVLSAAEARKTWWVDGEGGRALVITDAIVLSTAGGFQLQSFGKSAGELAVYPPLDLNASGFSLEPVKSEDRLACYKWSWPERSLSVLAEEIESGGRAEAAVRRRLPKPLTGIAAVKAAGAGPLSPGFLRAAFDSAGGAERDAARFIFVADDCLDVWVNGRFAGRGGHPLLLTAFSIGHLLRDGRNVVSVRLRRSRGEGRMLPGILWMDSGTGAPEVVGLGWRTVECPAPDWREPEFDDRGWEIAEPAVFDDGAEWRDCLEQPGPLYGRELSPLPDARRWRIRWSNGEIDSLEDAVLCIHYNGDTAALYSENRLISDDFQHGRPLQLSLRRAGLAGADGGLVLQVTPLTRRARLFMESDGLRRAAAVPAITKIELTPVYSGEARRATY